MAYKLKNHFKYRIVYVIFTVVMLNACQFNAKDSTISEKSSLEISASQLSLGEPIYVDMPGISNPEFSACMPAGEVDQYWVGSDENKKEIWKLDFFGTLLQKYLWDDKSHNDIEGLSQDGQGGFFMITSQSLNSTGESRNSRSRLSHFKDLEFDKNDRRTVGKFREVLVESFDWTEDALTLGPKLGGIDIEGLAYDPQHDQMWFGFRGPLTQNTTEPHLTSQAILIQLNRALAKWDPPNPFVSGAFDWDTHSPILLDLDGQGVRDLYYAGNHTLHILSGLIGSNPADSQPSGYLWEWNTETYDLIRLLEIPQVLTDPDIPANWSAAEGICWIGNKFVIVYDSSAFGIIRIINVNA